MHCSQTFTADWPDVLHEMLEYVRLTLFATGAGRRATIHVLFSRQLLRPEQLQPHAREFVKSLEELADVKIVVGAADGVAHQIAIHY